jgi:hypothetical protein
VTNEPLLGCAGAAVVVGRGTKRREDAIGVGAEARLSGRGARRWVFDGILTTRWEPSDSSQ